MIGHALSMAMRLHRLTPVLALGMLCAASHQLAGAQPTEAAAVNPEAVQIVRVALMPIDRKPYIAVIAENRSERPVWVYVSIEFNGPIRCGGERSELGPKKTFWYGCPVKSVIARHEYPIRVEVYPDAESTEIVEIREDKARFSKRDVKWLESQL